MTLISALFIIAGRFIVKIFITVFGWAMVIFFGRIPDDKNKLLSAIALLSLIWIILIIGITYPALTKAFYDYIPNNDLKHMISVLLETVGIVLIPIIVGEISVFMKDNNDKKIRDFVKATAKGYYYSVVMGISMILMLIIAPILTVKRFLLRQSTSSMPVIIQEKQINKVMATIKGGLEEKGYQVLIKKPQFLLSFPVFLIRWMLKDLLEKDISKNINIEGQGFKVCLNVSDILIEGNRNLTDKIKINIASVLMYERCYLTWGEDSCYLENKIYKVYLNYQQNKSKNNCIQELENLKEEMLRLDLEYHEWEIVLKKIETFEVIILKDMLL